MSVSYSAVGWNRQKLIYDGVLLGGVALYVGMFFLIGMLTGKGDATHDAASLAIRGLGTAGLILLHIILWIGPLARLDRRFLPLLYNRRHLGVTMFCVALAHATICTVQYAAFGDTSALVSLLSTNTGFLRLGAFPFELFGIGALLILFVMAATSHDFWLKTLSARVWKFLHMGVYLAYTLLILHVAFGALQQEQSTLLTGLLLIGVAITVGLHIAAGTRERASDAGAKPVPANNMIDVCAVEEIPLDRARVVCVPRGADGGGGERIAVFRYAQGKQQKVSAVANVCAHQQGPLGEGKVEGGCITCPWHGYQYKPGDGCAPAPFTEKIATYRVTVKGNRIMLDPRPMPPGTAVAPAIYEPAIGTGGKEDGRG